MEKIQCWDDLDDETRINALRDDSILASLKTSWPHADFSARDRLLARYEITARCRFCNAVTQVNYIRGVPEVCPQCRHAALDDQTAPGAVAAWLLRHYQFATTENRDQNIYVYEEKTGTWSDEKADAIMKHECGLIYGDRISAQKITNTRLAIQARTFVEADIFNTAIVRKGQKLLANVINGVVELDPLTAQMQLLNKAPEFYFTAYLPINYSPNAAVPERFLEFLAQLTLPNEENFINLLEALTYPLLPGMPIQRAVALIGAGQNGKSTFLKAIESFYGEKYISHLTLQQLSYAAEKSPFSIVQLQNKLANIADDLPNKPVYDVGYFKMLTGGSSVEAERKFGGRFSFINTAKFYFSGNQMPEVSEETAAFYRRFLFVEFSNTIKNPRDQDKVLQEIMSDDQKSGIFNLLLIFVVPKLLKKNEFTCARSVEAIEEQYKKHSNTAKLFFDEVLDYDPNGAIRKEDLWQAYQKYCGERGLILVSAKSFWSAFKQEFTMAVEKQYQEDGVHKRSLIGIHFKEMEQEPQNPNRGVKLLDYFNQQNQDNQHLSIFNIYKEVYTYIEGIRKKAGYAGNPGNAGSLQHDTPISSNTILESHTSPSPDGLPTAHQPGGEALSKSRSGVSSGTATVNPELIQGRVQSFISRLPSGVIAGPKWGDWSYLINSNFADLPQEEVAREFKKALELGDLLVLSRSDGLFSVAPARRQVNTDPEYDNIE